MTARPSLPSDAGRRATQLGQTSAAAVLQGFIVPSLRIAAAVFSGPAVDNFLTDTEVNRLLRAILERRHANAPRDYALFALLANTGARPCEILALRGRDLLPDFGVVRIQTAKRKGRHIRDQPVYPALLDRLELLARGREEFIFRGQRGRVLSVRAAEKLWDRYTGLARIQGRTLRSLRKTYGTRILEETGNPAAVRDLLGHSSLRSVDPYITLRDKRRAAAAVRPLTGDTTHDDANPDASGGLGAGPTLPP